ncbi:siderophore-interacting protein [Paraglaciecola sp.]|uniref:siderophore-interacting protein n=1 Tax=Paraglaciecola sp. TaxID=1920173 RepID=UPI003EF962DB
MGPKMRMTQVKKISDLSPHMRRIVLSGDSLADFPTGKKSAHVKVIFPNPAKKDTKPKLGLYLGFKKWMRSYTIREFDPQTKSLSLDFAINDHQGLASNWAAQAQVGDYLGIAGSGDVKHTNLNAPHHLLFGDLTALPVIAATLEMLPAGAKGKAFIQVPSEQDIQVVTKPEGIDLNWLVTTDKMTDGFINALSQEDKNLNDTAILIAAEASIVKQLKSFLNQNCNYNKSNLYASAYWNSKK